MYTLTIEIEKVLNVFLLPLEGEDFKAKALKNTSQLLTQT